MTSAATKPASGAGGRHAGGRGHGMVVLAALVLAWAAVDVVALRALCACGGRAAADAVWADSDWGTGA